MERKIWKAVHRSLFKVSACGTGPLFRLHVAPVNLVIHYACSNERQSKSQL